MCFRQGRATGKKEKMFPARSGDWQEGDVFPARSGDWQEGDVFPARSGDGQEGDVFPARSGVYFGKVEKEKGDLAEVIGLWR
ncbi:MAG: hypothetical protein IKQ01_00415 [Bacteroidales bacterium]|nr:hypothetical protein [Bacteroidales bacterium]